MHLSRIWSEVLVIEQVGLHDNFFDLGGDSLLATKVAVRVLRELKVEVTVKTLFDAPTIAQMAAKISEKGAGEAADLEVTTLPDRIESLSDEEIHLWLQQHDT